MNIVVLTTGSKPGTTFMTYSISVGTRIYSIAVQCTSSVDYTQKKYAYENKTIKLVIGVLATAVAALNLTAFVLGFVLLPYMGNPSGYLGVGLKDGTTPTVAELEHTGILALVPEQVTPCGQHPR